MRDLDRRLKAAELAARGGALPILSEKTGRLLGYVAGRDAVTLLNDRLREQVAAEGGQPPENSVTAHPLWRQLGEAAPFGPEAGSLLECVRREARAWAEAQAAGKNGSG